MIHCISLEDILFVWDHRRIKKSRLSIFIDSCYSGNWCYNLSKKSKPGLNVIIYSACGGSEVAFNDHGRLFLKCITEMNGN